MHDLDWDEVRHLREQKMTAQDIATRLGVSKQRVLMVIRKLGLLRSVTREKPVDVPKLFATWNDTRLTMSEVARELGITTGYLYRLADRYGLEERQHVMRTDSMEDAESPEDEAASRDSLALAPGVQRRIKELGLGMPVLEHPDVRPWFAVTTEPGPYADDPEDWYSYDE